MTGHAQPFVTEAVAGRRRRGITTMLPSEDGIWVGAELARRFGLPLWQFALTATDANRFVLRIARYVTGPSEDPGLRLVLSRHRRRDPRHPGPRRQHPSCGPPTSGPRCIPLITTKVVEFNDLAALEAALAPGDVACVLAEPALTNIGIVLPDPGFHDALRRIDPRDRHAARHRRDPHHLRRPGRGAPRPGACSPTCSPSASPSAAGCPPRPTACRPSWGALGEFFHSEGVDVSGIGGTLAGNALAVAAMRATLGERAHARRTSPDASRWRSAGPPA